MVHELRLHWFRRKILFIKICQRNWSFSNIGNCELWVPSINNFEDSSYGIRHLLDNTVEETVAELVGLVSRSTADDSQLEWQNCTLAKTVRMYIVLYICNSIRRTRFIPQLKYMYERTSLIVCKAIEARAWFCIFERYLLLIVKFSFHAFTIIQYLVRRTIYVYSNFIIKC